MAKVRKVNGGYVMDKSVSGVYRRDGEKCPYCGETVRAIKVGGKVRSQCGCGIVPRMDERQRRMAGYIHGEPSAYQKRKARKQANQSVQPPSPIPPPHKPHITANTHELIDRMSEDQLRGLLEAYNIEVKRGDDVRIMRERVRQYVVDGVIRELDVRWTCGIRPERLSRERNIRLRQSDRTVVNEYPREVEITIEGGAQIATAKKWYGRGGWQTLPKNYYIVGTVHDGRLMYNRDYRGVSGFSDPLDIITARTGELDSAPVLGRFMDLLEGRYISEDDWDMRNVEGETRVVVHPRGRLFGWGENSPIYGALETLEEQGIVLEYERMGSRGLYIVVDTDELFSIR